MDTLRGTLEGVPRLLETFQRYETHATFLFSLGPDHTGRAIKRCFRRGFVGKVSRTSVLSHYGLKTLLYGTLLPGPDIGLRAAPVMCAVRDAGFDVGIHCWDHVLWQDHVADADIAWTTQQINLAVERFTDIFGASATVHGAAGWQMNDHVLRLYQNFGITYASDTRGTHPFRPVLGDGTVLHTPQLPTTLPTLDELIGVGGVTPENVANYLLALTRNPPATGHIFTLHAELEGGAWRPILEQLLIGWRQQGYQLGGLHTLLAALDVLQLPAHRLVFGHIPGRAGTLLLQGAPC